MNPTPILITYAIIGGLASCTTPAERCNASISAEQRNVSRLLEEVETNIVRCYAYETTPAYTPGFRICAGGFRHDSDRLGLGYSSCYGGDRTIRERVAIDPESELRKRAALRNRLAALSAAGGAQCGTRSQNAS
ncbi:hypothetical protein [Paracoccus sp. 228]|uniref:hypothetical protein n=1 Tax=Paracoccus sp. 228 TaxID=1192054 RepID=UPI000A00AB75|nr:hypothetical protein [Paracoccus sp. 228]